MIDESIIGRLIEKCQRFLDNEPLKQAVIDNLNNCQPLIQKVNQLLKDEDSQNHKEAVLSYIKLIEAKIDIARLSDKPYAMEHELDLQMAADITALLRSCLKPLREQYDAHYQHQKNVQSLQTDGYHRLATLLEQEQAHCNSQKAFTDALTDIANKQPKTSNHPPSSCYIAYAWKTPEHAKREVWVLPFLRQLKAHLIQAGITTTQLDIESNPKGSDINQYMKQIKKPDSIVILIGTESLLQMHQQGISAVCTELIHINRKHATDKKARLYRIIPILLSGTLEAAFPAEYKRYNTVMDWRHEGYLKNIQKLIYALYGYTDNRSYHDYQQGHWQVNIELPQITEQRLALKRDLEKNLAALKRVQGAPDFSTQPAASPPGAPSLALFDIELNNLPRANSSFTGRVKELKRLEEKLNDEGGSGVITQVITGLGGVGKTELAIAFANQQAKHQLYEFIHWVQSDPELLEGNFIELATLLGVDTKIHQDKALTRQVNLTLAKRSRWLIIFDNAEHYQAIESYLPNQQKGQHIIITTRDQTGLPPKQRLTLDVFESHESAALIREHISATDEQCQDLHTLLEGLPLALRQAVAYIERQSMSVQDYIARYNEQGPMLLTKQGYRVNQSKYPKAIHTTWVLTQELIKTSPHASRLLDLCAYLSPEVIPRDFLESIMDKPSVESAIDLLSRYSLIHIQKKLIKIHCLQQDVLRCQHEQPVQQSHLLMLAIALLERLKDFDEMQPETWPTAKCIVAHARALMGHIKPGELDSFSYSLHFYVAIIINRQCLYKQSMEHYQKALNVAERTEGRDSKEVAGVLSNIGVAYGALGDAAKKKQLLGRALKIFEQVYGEQHPDVAITLTNLGNAYGDLGDAAKQKQLLERALKIQVQIYGEQHPQVAITHHNLVSACVSLGDFSSATRFAQKAHNTFKQVLGEQHPHTQKSLQKLQLLSQAQAKGRSNNTLLSLCVAAYKGHLATVESLIKSGAAVNTTDSDGATALMNAIIKNHVDIFDRLLSAGADINKANHKGHTPLMVAVRLNREEIANTLMALGADTTQCDKKGFNALLHALRHGQVALAEILLTKETHDTTKKHVADFIQRIKNKSLTVGSRDHYTQLLWLASLVQNPQPDFAASRSTDKTKGTHFKVKPANTTGTISSARRHLPTPTISNPMPGPATVNATQPASSYPSLPLSAESPCSPSPGPLPHNAFNPSGTSSRHDTHDAVLAGTLPAISLDALKVFFRSLQFDSKKNQLTQSGQALTAQTFKEKLAQLEQHFLLINIGSRDTLLELLTLIGEKLLQLGQSIRIKGMQSDEVLSNLYLTYLKLNPQNQALLNDCITVHRHYLRKGDFTSQAILDELIDKYLPTPQSNTLITAATGYHEIKIYLEGVNLSKYTTLLIPLYVGARSLDKPAQVVSALDIDHVVLVYITKAHNPKLSVATKTSPEPQANKDTEQCSPVRLTPSTSTNPPSIQTTPQTYQAFLIDSMSCESMTTLNDKPESSPAPNRCYMTLVMDTLVEKGFIIKRQPEQETVLHQGTWKLNNCALEVLRLLEAILSSQAQISQRVTLTTASSTSAQTQPLKPTPALNIQQLALTQSPMSEHMLEQYRVELNEVLLANQSYHSDWLKSHFGITQLSRDDSLTDSRAAPRSKAQSPASSSANTSSQAQPNEKSVDTASQGTPKARARRPR